MSTFFTSNIYFSDNDACKKYGREFDDIDIMDSTLISKWNSVVMPNDIVYVLGDFGNYDKLSSLNGRIVLLEGESENKFFGGKIYDDRVRHFATKYGVSYLEDAEIDIKTDLPISKLALNQRQSDIICKPHHTGICNLYADSEDSDINTLYGINVAIDLHNLKPVSLDTVLFYAKGLLR